MTVFDPTAPTHIVTCHTEGCRNVDVGIPMPLMGEDGTEMVTDVRCGACGQPITDIVAIPVATDEVTE